MTKGQSRIRGAAKQSGKTPGGSVDYGAGQRRLRNPGSPKINHPEAVRQQLAEQERARQQASPDRGKNSYGSTARTSTEKAAVKTVQRGK